MVKKPSGKQLMDLAIDVVFQSWKYRQRKQSSRTREASVTRKRKSFNPKGIVSHGTFCQHMTRQSLDNVCATQLLTCHSDTRKYQGFWVRWWNEKYVGRNLHRNLMRGFNCAVNATYAKKIMRKLMCFSLHICDVQID